MFRGHITGNCSPTPPAALTIAAVHIVIDIYLVHTSLVIRIGRRKVKYRLQSYIYNLPVTLSPNSLYMVMTTISTVWSAALGFGHQL